MLSPTVAGPSVVTTSDVRVMTSVAVVSVVSAVVVVACVTDALSEICVVDEGDVESLVDEATETDAETADRFELVTGVVDGVNTGCVDGEFGVKSLVAVVAAVCVTDAVDFPLPCEVATDCAFGVFVEESVVAIETLDGVPTVVAVVAVKVVVGGVVDVVEPGFSVDTGAGGVVLAGSADPSSVWKSLQS